MFLGSAQATFDSKGNANVTIGPQRARESWRVQQIVTHTTSTAQTKLDVFRYEVGGPRLDHSDRANNDVSPCDYDVPSGQVLAFQWSGGTPGTTAQIDLDGVRNGV